MNRFLSLCTRCVVVIFLCTFFASRFCNEVFAQDINVGADTDNDGLSDFEEINMYKTDPFKLDTDNDGYADGEEVRSGYSPLLNERKKMSEIDSDSDGLNDAVEIALGTYLNTVDSDGDGVSDGEEANKGFDPLSSSTSRDDQRRTVSRHVEVDLTNQVMHYFLNSVELGTIPVSTGKIGTLTPKGTFSIFRKLPVHHYIGENYNLPNTKWNLEFKRGFYLHGAYWHNQFGIRPMSHGCVNIGYKGAEKIYSFLDIGDKVTVYGITPLGKVKKKPVNA